MKHTLSQKLGLAAILALGAPFIVNACSVENDVTITFYGFPDNDPPGASTAYNCGDRNNIAGGKHALIRSISNDNFRLFLTIYTRRRNLRRSSYLRQRSRRVLLL